MVKPNQIIDWLIDTEYEYKTRSIGSKLSTYKNIQKRKVKGLTEYKLTKSIIKEGIIDRYFPNLLKSENETLPNTTNTTNTTTLPKILLKENQNTTRFID